MNPKVEIALKSQKAGFALKAVVFLAFVGVFVFVLWASRPTETEDITLTYEGGTHPEFNLTMGDNWRSHNQTDMNTLKQSLITYLNSQPNSDTLCGERCVLESLN
tara:strand:- start:1414 stop:1728 length:315 start_codon:yes stop_codon:yes gene_type:complete